MATSTLAFIFIFFSTLIFFFLYSTSPSTPVASLCLQWGDCVASKLSCDPNSEKSSKIQGGLAQRRLGSAAG